MENISVQTLYQLCAVVDGVPGVPTPLGWLDVWKHLPNSKPAPPVAPPPTSKLRGNHAALYQKWIEIAAGPIDGPIFVPVPVYVLGIQGTKDAQEILEDFDVETQVPFPPAGSSAMIAKGSSDALAAVLDLCDDKTKVSLADALRGLPANAYLVVTGHSLGGNVASVLGPWIAANVPHFSANRSRPAFPSNLGVVTFAAPTAGNQAFARFLDRQRTYEAHFNYNDVVSNVWAEDGELSLAHVERLFPGPGLGPAPLAVRELLHRIRRKMKPGVRYAQTRGQRFVYPIATPPESKDDDLKRWLWELGYQHNDAYNHTFLPPEARAPAAVEPAPLLVHSNVYINNQISDLDLQLSTSVDPPLDSSYWGVEGDKASANGQSTYVLWFNRNTGIKKDKTWVFTTQLTLDEVTVTLQEKVTGTTAGSTLWQQISAGGASTGWQDTQSPRTLLFKGQSGAVWGISWSLTSGGYADITYTVWLDEPAIKRIPPVMPQIETIVFLMLENRSLDTVLGWLYQNGNPPLVYPPGSSPSFDGAKTSMSNGVTIRGETRDYSPQQGTGGFLQPCRTPQFDPYEPMDNVQYQLYANASGQMPGGYFWADTPTMTGFAYDYYASYEVEPGEVMGAYSAAELPVLYGLAQNFAVSDRWFCSVPTQTDPNRAFSICGTSNGAEANSDIDSSTFADTQTLFNALGVAGKTWGVYWQSEGIGTGEPVGTDQPYTSYYFPMLDQAPNGGVEPFSAFQAACLAGTLPNFCYLEPYWGGGKGDLLSKDDDGWVGVQGNDYHPPSWVGPGEADLNALYNALIASPQWPNMLFVITFDEHGGTWDHVPPTATVAPDERTDENFAFDRLGVRVPTILVSPYIPEGLVFRSPSSQYDFDHTSFIATFLKWAGVDPSSNGLGLGKRVASAPTFEGVLSEVARSDTPTFSVPDDYAQQGGGVGTLHLGGSGQVAGPEPIGVRDLRHALEGSLTTDELRVRLHALTLKKPKERPESK